MYARVTTFKFEPARAGEVAAKFKEMAPAARTLPGAVNVYAAWRADGQGSVTAIYKSKAEADAAAAENPGNSGAACPALIKGAPSTEAYDSVEHMVGSRAQPSGGVHSVRTGNARCRQTSSDIAGGPNERYRPIG